MEIQTEKKMIETSGRLIAEKGSAGPTLDLLSIQPEKELKELIDDISFNQNSHAEEFEMPFNQSATD